MTLIKNVQLTSLLVGLIFILVSILFKLGAAPYHMWLPDVYEGVPTILTAFFAIIPKLAMFVLFVNFSLMVFGPNFLILKNLILLSIFFSLLIGITGALYQSKFKRLLAYSAIAHIGFLLLGYSSLTNFGLFALFFYLIAYMLMSLNVFTILLTLRKINNNLALKKINEITLLFKSNPLLAVSFAVVLFSVAGIPPLLGFYSKLFVFIAAIFSNLYNIVIVAALLSVVASLYYIRLIKLLFFKNFDF